MEIVIRPDDLADGEVIALLEQHHREMQQYSPPESIHALNRADFFDPALTFWSARDGDNLAACGALRQLSTDQGEIKAMRTAARYLRKGIAEKVLLRILAEARLRGYRTLNLETGSHEAFLPAIGLYQKHGFRECEPFGDFEPDPYSRFFELAIPDV